ncbi:MAG: tRNA (adenosine(37)-N6)-threonylcarbamoyltransferase complex ATPase subunit type 1 TsaE [Calditrichaeota bacterium]|nr:tRNA (adenosine(37)-N6)-threonylcarbamoyltransferase complex ATPase subunit type 1 TsaE [Calditrichota bacterium]RQW04778.1 MAG: tRNA (adenosine(37)-N6)-threonylcarbamoyltransferase complex ATPase subunit type 1 TsaE [Calditrichota bacterium]
MNDENSEIKKYLEQVAFSPEETAAVASRFAGELNGGDIVAFYGQLGSGKTFFINSLCRKLGVHQSVTSPTFTIINEYSTANGLYIYHFDFYRLENKTELQNLGLDDFFYSDYLCLIEWADKIFKFLPERRWEVFLEFLPDKPEARKIKIVRINES